VNLQDLLWEDPEFKPLLERLEKDRDVAYMVQDMKTVFAALACMSSAIPPTLMLWY
jgi:hypothetical protein